jgi:hypothetical protein
MDEYEYDYHDLADGAYPVEDYYNDGVDEPWMDEDDDIDWDNYYHNLTDEILDD